MIPRTVYCELSVEIHLTNWAKNRPMGFDLNVLHYKRKMIPCIFLNVIIDTEERCFQMLTKMDSNHEKSEVKVVFIRTGFHTTLLHKTRKQSAHLELCFQNMDRVKTEKSNNIQNNPVQTCTISPSLLYCHFGQYLIDKKKKKVKQHPMYIHIQVSEI